MKRKPEIGKWSVNRWAIHFGKFWRNEESSSFIEFDGSRKIFIKVNERQWKWMTARGSLVDLARKENMRKNES